MLKAEGRVYTLGDAIGMTRSAVYDIDVLKEAVKGAVPLVNSFGSLNDPERVIGHCDLDVRGDELWASVTILGPYEDTMKAALDSGYSPKLGFYAVGVLEEELDEKLGGGYAVTSMSIRSVALNETCHGGSLENIKKE